MNYLSFIGGAALALGMGTLARHATHRVPKGIAADSTYTLTGNIEGMDAGWVWLLHSQADGRLDSVRVNKGAFVFSGRVSEPEHCRLGIVGKEGRKDFALEFFLQGGPLQLTAKKDALENGVVTGGSVEDEYREFEAKENAVFDWSKWSAMEQAAQAKKDKAQADSLSTLANTMSAKQKQLAKDYAKAHPSSYVAVFELLNYFTYNPDADELQDLYQGLDTAIRASHSGIALKKTLDAALLTGIGRPAPDFTQTDEHGKAVALSSFKGKYVLVDFWASWCGPCRAENPNVLSAYRQYKAKGFTILGVSLDDQKDKWIGAIRKDALPWTQVSDLKGWKNSVALLYGVEGIPMNFLLDKDGKIVAKGLRGSDLDKKLEELVH
jgi:peroxiredoxin